MQRKRGEQKLKKNRVGKDLIPLSHIFPCRLSRTLS